MSLLEKVEAPQRLKSVQGFEHRLSLPQGNFVAGVRNAVPHYYDNVTSPEAMVDIYGDLFLDSVKQENRKFWTPTPLHPFITTPRTIEVRTKEILLKEVELGVYYSTFRNFLTKVQIKLLNCQGVAIPDEETAEKLLYPIYKHYSTLARDISLDYHKSRQASLHPNLPQTKVRASA